MVLQLGIFVYHHFKSQSCRKIDLSRVVGVHGVPGERPPTKPTSTFYTPQVMFIA